MLKEILLNRGVWVVVFFLLFSMFYFVEEAYEGGAVFLFLHYALLAALYTSIILYAAKKIDAARLVAAEIYVKEVSYGRHELN